LLALGLVLIYRTTGVLNFGHWAIGLMALTTYALLTGAGVPVVVALVVGLVASILTGIICYRFVFRRVPRSSQIIVVLITFGVAQLFSSLSALALGFKTVTTLPGWIPAAIWHVRGATIYSKDIVTILVAVWLSAGFLIWFRASRTGRALRAVAPHPQGAM